MTEQTNAAKPVYNTLGRGMDETYEDYCARRKAMNKEAKKLKYGKEFWDSGYAGSYKNPDKRKLQAERKARREMKRG